MANSESSFSPGYGTFPPSSLWEIQINLQDDAQDVSYT